MRTVKRILPFLLLAVMVLAGCTPAAPPEPEKKTRESGDVYGIYSGEITTINYLVTSTTAEFSVAANTVDCLVEYDNLGIVRPALATEWSISDDGTVWTFKIREGVKWYNYKGEEYAEVTAQDWVDALKYSFNPDNASKTANIAYSVIKNGEAYFKGEIDDFEQVGVKAIDKYTLEYTLNHPVPYFLSMLTYCPSCRLTASSWKRSATSLGQTIQPCLQWRLYILGLGTPNQREYIKNENYWMLTTFINKIVSKYNKEPTRHPRCFSAAKSQAPAYQLTL